MQQEQTERIYLGISKGKSLTSKIIKWFQWGDPHTHIFYIKDLNNLSNPYIIEAWHQPMLKGGQVREGYFFENNLHTKGTEFDIYYIEVTPEQKVKFEYFLEKQIGKKYDFAGIFGFATRLKKTQDPNKWFCSELIYSALVYAGIILFKNTVAQEVYPSLIIKSPRVNKLDINTIKSQRTRKYKGNKNVKSRV